MGEDDKKKKEKKELPKGTAASSGPDVIAFATMGDSRVLSGPHSMSTLFQLVAKELGASTVLTVPDPDAATKELISRYPLVDSGKGDGELAPRRAIKRVMFVGHGGPSDAGLFWAFSGKPPVDANPHNFSMLVKDCLSADLPYPTSHFFDLLAERLVPDAQIWFISCYNGQKLVAAVAKELTSAKAPKFSVGGYDGDIGFKWDTDTKSTKTPPPFIAKAMKPFFTAFVQITVADPRFDKTAP